MFERGANLQAKAAVLVVVSAVMLSYGCDRVVPGDAAAQISAPPQDPFWTHGPGYQNPAAGHSETWNWDGDHCLDHTEPSPHELVEAGAKLRLERVAEAGASPLWMVKIRGFDRWQGPERIRLQYNAEDDSYTADGILILNGDNNAPHAHNLKLFKEDTIPRPGHANDICMQVSDENNPGLIHGGSVHFGD